MRLTKVFVLAAALAIFCAPIFSQAAAPPAAPRPATTPVDGTITTLSSRIVAYQIEAKLDPTKHTIAASETLTYKNLTGQPQQTFPFHLYLNAFQPQSTFMTEVRLAGTRGSGPDSEWDPKHFGSITVDKLEVEGAGDLTTKMEFIHPDDKNTDDRTVFQVTLPKAIAPGASVEFHIAFHDVLPKVVERTGYAHNFDMVGQWFPKVGVWWKNAWNCHQFHATTEFFADFGTFDVKITVPQNEIVGAGGDLVSSTNNSDGTKTLTYHSEDVHDFSWTASPSFTVVEDSWTGSQGPVKIHLLMSPGHMASAQRYIDAQKGSLRLFDQWYGPYPYDRITMVDPPHGGVDAGGMEYPTLITLGTGVHVPQGVLAPEIVTEHEFGHQYWYGMVATNEFEEAWLDEGINSYTEVKVMDALYGKNTSAINLPFAQISETGLQQIGYLADPDQDPVARFAWKFINNNSYGGITYGKTAIVLLTLEKVIGEDTLRQALHTYFMRYRFTHPTGEDFLKTIEEVSGKDLRWYFNQAIYGTQVLDYSLADAHSDPLKWWDTPAHPSKKNDKDEVYRTSITVVRKGDFVLPVDVDIKFDDGSTAVEHWDGQDRWVRYQYDRKAKIQSAQIDAHNQMTLDRDSFNNSFTEEADPRAAHKLRTIWVFASEWLSQLLAWLT
jgi:peptidase M1-like protein